MVVGLARVIQEPATPTARWAELNEPTIEQYWRCMSDSKPSSPQRFPDLYALLSLQPLESDRAAIEAALRRLAAQIKSNQLADDQDKASARNVKLFEFGKLHLLSAERKQRYDQQWRKVFRAKAARSSDEQVPCAKPVRTIGSADPQAKDDADSELLKWLPSGNPDEPFRLADYLQNSGGQTRPNDDADFEKLQTLLRSAVDPQPTKEAQPAHALGTENAAAVETLGAGAARERDGIVEREGEEAGERKPRRSVGLHWSKQPVSASVPAISLARQRSRQREKWAMWGAIAGLALLGSILGLFFWLNAMERNNTKVRTAAVASNDHAGSASAIPLDSPPAVATPRRSGLPSVAGLNPDQDLTQGIDALVPVAPAETATDVPSMPDLNAVSTSPPSDTLPSTEMADPTMPPLTSMPPENSVSPELSDSDRAAWAVAMTEVKRLIGEQQYAPANQQLTAAEAVAKSIEQRAQLQRLKSISQLSEELQQALRAAIEGMRAGEVVTIGSSTPVGFVEWDQERLTVRIRGENRKFALKDLPIGLVFALSDISLAAEAPSTKARKAAFAMVHPGAAGNDLAAQRAREMMSAAAAAGVVDEDLLNAFDD